MLTVQKALRYGAIALMGLGIGCSGDVAPEAASGNAALGIAKFEVNDTAGKTSVIGRDAAGSEVGRLDLVHGQFTVSEQFKDSYPGEPRIDGRKMEVTLRGVKHLVWETAGYQPTLQLPAHPVNEATLAAFLADPHVKPVLDHWQIGFEPGVDGAPGPDGEIAYGEGGSTAGTDPFDCSYPATNCGVSGRGKTMNTCGGGAPGMPVKRVTRTVAGGYTYNEHVIDQCCPTGAGGQTTNWFATKSCPNTTVAGKLQEWRHRHDLRLRRRQRRVRVLPCLSWQCRGRLPSHGGLSRAPVLL